MELLHCEFGQQPTVRQLDFWHTLSDCLTALEIELDWKQRQKRLQPHLLSQLRALRALTFRGEEGYSGWEVSDGDTIDLPELRELYVEGYRGNHLRLECPSLTSLTLKACNPMPLVSLQSPLQKLDTMSAGKLCMHDGLPLTTFLNLISLRVECEGGHEELLFPSLPMLTKLQTLELVVSQGSLLQSLPRSLCTVSLYYPDGECWDSQILPALQRLPELREVNIEVDDYEEDYEEDCLASLSCDLQPFMALQHLHILQIGGRRAWAPSSLRALGQFEADLIRAGSKLKLLC